jgi:hypothetical protein
VKYCFFPYKIIWNRTSLSVLISVTDGVLTSVGNDITSIFVLTSFIKSFVLIPFFNVIFTEETHKKDLASILSTPSISFTSL